LHAHAEFFHARDDRWRDLFGVQKVDAQLVDWRLRVRGFERIEYPIERAVDNFLKHAGGVSDAARRALLAAARVKKSAPPEQLELGAAADLGEDLI
jgi:hypothetical protein